MSKKRCSSLKKIRFLAYKAQSGLCYYCDQPMWENDIESFLSQYNIARSKASLLKSTAEHLTARKDGGINAKSNIVAACKYCNSTRHKSKDALSPESYKKRVQKRLSDKKWHQIQLTGDNSKQQKALN